MAYRRNLSDNEIESELLHDTVSGFITSEHFHAVFYICYSSALVEAQRYKSEGPRFDSQWCF
jgi:hypothetical protein